MNDIDLRRIDLNLLVVFEVLMTERSVTRAAEHLGRTQSAVSHSLSRLREQLGDPLLIRAGGHMQPSPYAMRLVDEIRPILRGIQRVLAPSDAFDPRRSSRVFRIAAPDFALTLFPALLGRIHSAAPGVGVDWSAPSQQMLLKVADGQLDLAILPAGIKLPEGVFGTPIGALQWRCFGRRGHPGFATWGRRAWGRWPHVVVSVGDRLHSPVMAVTAALGVKRRVAAWVPNFAAVAPLLEATDLLATLPAIAMVDARERFGLVAKPVPIPIEPLPHAMAWNARMAKDPGAAWLRQLVGSVFADFSRRAEAAI